MLTSQYSKLVHCISLHPLPCDLIFLQVYIWLYIEMPNVDLCPSFLSSLFQQPSHCVIETGQRADLSEEEMMNVISETRCRIYFTVCMIIINCQYLRITILCLYTRSFYSLHVLMRCKISYCDNNAVPNFYHLALWDLFYFLDTKWIRHNVWKLFSKMR